MLGDFYTIESPDKKWRAEISARFGANVTKLQYNNEDIYVPLKDEKQLSKNPFLIGSPMLLPANRTYKGEFMFKGRIYNLPINDSLNVSHLHGFLHSQNFNVLKVDDQKVTLFYENIGWIYPFKFKIIVEYSISNNGFKQCYSIENKSDCEMPYTFALHTTFVEPKIFSVPIDFCQEKDEVHIPTGRYIELDDQEKLYTVGSKAQNLKISGYYRSCGNTAQIGSFKYKVSDNFDHWILYNDGGKSEILCVEPQSGAVNGLNIKDGFNVLRPKCCETFVTEISTI